jgi:hypothetical protein
MTRSFLSRAQQLRGSLVLVGLLCLPVGACQRIATMLDAMPAGDVPPPLLLTELSFLGADTSTQTNSRGPIFGEIFDLAIDQAGNIIVADRKMQSVTKFDPKGQPVWTKDDVGRGPGEFISPWLVDIFRDKIYIFDIGRRKVVELASDSTFLDEFTIPYFLYSLRIVAHDQILAAGIISGRPNMDLDQMIHLFDNSGQTKLSFGSEIKFRPKDTADHLAQQIIYQYYAGHMSVVPWAQNLLVSPIFDATTFLYDRKGKFLQTYRNPNFRHELLNYEPTHAGATFNALETRSGPMVPVGGRCLVKTYQITDGEDLRYFMDIFRPDGELIWNQIPFSGLVLEATADGRLYAVRNTPYPVVLQYKLDFTELDRKVQ